MSMDVSIDQAFVMDLKGRPYVTYDGVLDAATGAGLRSLTTRPLQIPGPENGGLAVVIARAEFEDGRVFEDVGDCSPQTTTPQLAAAALRLASTRAKGRVLRDAINVAAELMEELPSGWEARQATAVADRHRPQAAARTHSPSRSPAPRPAATPGGNGSGESAPHPVAANGNGAHASAERPGAVPLVCGRPKCGKPTTPKFAEAGQAASGMPLCRACFEALASRPPG